MGQTKQISFGTWWKQLPLLRKILVIVGVIGLVGAVGWYVKKTQTPTTTYQTAAVSKGSLVSTVSSSGTITSVNRTNIQTKDSGVVSAVYVNNGDTVTKGQKIALVTLDEYGLERQTTAWKNYLDAQTAVMTAQADQAQADIDMWNARNAIFKAQDAVDYKNNNTINPVTKLDYTDSEKAVIDKTPHLAQLQFNEAETRYNNSSAAIAAARSQVSAALRDYQQNSAIIVAPSAGVVSDLSLTPGMVVASTQNSNTNTNNSNSIEAVAAQTVGKIGDPKGSLLATVPVSEVDVIKVKPGQKATILFDAYPDLSFTGKVLAVDTDGTVTSGVTTYKVTIVLDPTDTEIYPNMAITANIITGVENDVLLVPSTAISSSGDQSTVEVMKNGTPSMVTVQTGSANDTYTVITTGLNEGDQVVTAKITKGSTSGSSSSTTSPFSGIGGRSSGNVRFGGPGF
jgi:multidrug efflux pump subunit AcrA (membrane-fusion protein)